MANDPRQVKEKHCSRQLEFGLLTIGRIRNAGGMLQGADRLRATWPKPSPRKCRAGRRGTGSAHDARCSQATEFAKGGIVQEAKAGTMEKVQGLEAAKA